MYLGNSDDDDSIGGWAGDGTREIVWRLKKGGKKRIITHFIYTAIAREFLKKRFPRLEGAGKGREIGIWKMNSGNEW